MKSIHKGRLLAVNGKKLLVIEKQNHLKRFTLPGGIKKKKETLEQGIARETQEEIELIINPEKIKHVVSFRVKDNAMLTKHYFSLNIKTNTFKVLETEKFKDVYWIHWKKARNYLDKEDRKAVKEYFNKNKKSAQMIKAQFHLALPCASIQATKDFYTKILGATQGRHADKWVDINLYDNQLTFTEAGAFSFDFKNYKLGDSILPAFHFGVIVSVAEWGRLYGKLFQSNQEVSTEATFMENKIGEHLSFFITDPNGYMIEFKSFKNKGEVFIS